MVAKYNSSSHLSHSKLENQRRGYLGNYSIFFLVIMKPPVLKVKM
jgi:hypothetical protein